jgi:hypothetical protein
MKSVLLLLVKYSHFVLEFLFFFAPFFFLKMIHRFSITNRLCQALPIRRAFGAMLPRMAGRFARVEGVVRR